MSKLCSCIVPCFNEEEVIPLYYEEMQKVRKQEEGKIDFEIIFIDDGSKDKTIISFLFLKVKESGHI